MKKIWTLIRKEWAEVFKNRFVLFTVAFMPLLFTVLPLVILYATGTGAEDTGDTVLSSDLPPQFAELCSDMNGMSACSITLSRSSCCSS